jgi:hypothetical protein
MDPLHVVILVLSSARPRPGDDHGVDRVGLALPARHLPVWTSRTPGSPSGPVVSPTRCRRTPPSTMTRTSSLRWVRHRRDQRLQLRERHLQHPAGDFQPAAASTIASAAASSVSTAALPRSSRPCRSLVDTHTNGALVQALAVLPASRRAMDTRCSPCLVARSASHTALDAAARGAPDRAIGARFVCRPWREGRRYWCRKTIRDMVSSMGPA